ncbi:MAG: cytochrome c biogenesis protein CcsA [Deltaproteobacteria bacterium]|nr:cytochrome c biogenesis protein CcsA [Deltaproteobacteria bacterium]
MTDTRLTFPFLKHKSLPLIDSVCIALVGAAILYSNYLVFLVVPNERIMGPVQRIFYFHVGSAIACYCAFGVVLIASLAYLATRDRRADVVAEAAGEVGFVFCTIVLLTGMIWGHAAWNTWFRWEPRLVSFLLLWLIFLSFTTLRVFGDPKKIAAHSAVLGIIGAVTVPLVVYSIKLLPQMAQLHPQILENRGLVDPTYKPTLFVCMGSLVCLQALLIWFRVRIGLLEAQRRD